MENQPVNQSTVSSEQSTVSAMTPSTVHRSPNSFLVLLLSILLLISCIIAGFFAFQTQQLVNELRVMRDELKQTPIVSPEPTAEADDPTADWKTYTDKDGLFNLKYPSVYTLSGMGIMSPLNSVSNEKDLTLQNGELKIEFFVEDYSSDMTVESCWKDHTINTEGITSRNKVIISGISYETILWKGMGTGEFTCIRKGNKRILINKYPAVTTRQSEYYQILSTFKFTN